MLELPAGCVLRIITHQNTKPHERNDFSGVFLKRTNDDTLDSGYGHIPVMANPAVASLLLKPDSIVIDCTLGGGGHARRILDQLGKSGKIIAFDRDINAIAHAEKWFAGEIGSGKMALVHQPFSEIGTVCKNLGLRGQINAILADIGVSSPQLDQGIRGFSFIKDGPLDMRMDQSTGPTAADLVSDLDELNLAKIFRDLGEEPMARHFAKMICRERNLNPFSSTAQLAAFIEKHSPYGSKSKKHPATKIFQALRIAVNDELGELSRFMHEAISCLAPGGRLAIITFHSLEDRLVKRFFSEVSGRTKKQSLVRHVALTEQEIDRIVDAAGRVVDPSPIEPTAEEVAINPRARSARLRVFEKGH